MQRKGKGYQRVEPLGCISYLGSELVSADLKSGGRTEYKTTTTTRCGNI